MSFYKKNAMIFLSNHMYLHQIKMHFYDNLLSLSATINSINMKDNIFYDQSPFTIMKSFFPHSHNKSTLSSVHENKKTRKFGAHFFGSNLFLAKKENLNKTIYNFDIFMKQPLPPIQ